MRSIHINYLFGLAATAGGLVPSHAQFNTLEKWGNADNTTPPASFAAVAGTIQITGGGSDFWAASDQGTFLWDSTGSQTTTGDFTATVRHVGTVNPAPEWGRDGIMARAPQSAGMLSANDAYWMACRKSNGQVIINRRSVAGGNTYRATDVDNAAVNYDSDDNDRALATGGVTGNPWFLAAGRSGNSLYSGYAMDLGDGVAGRFIGQWATEATAAVGNFAAGTELIVGLAHQSHPQTITPDSNDINVATFDQWTYSVTFDQSRFGTAASASTWQVAGSVRGDGATGEILGSAFVSEFGAATGEPVKWTVQVYPLSSFSPAFGTGGTRRDPTPMNLSLAVPSSHFRQGGEGSPAGLKADIHINAVNANNLAGNLALMAGSAPENKASAIIQSPYWSANNYPVDEQFQNVFALALPGQFGGDQSNYGVEMTGQIFIPADADRVQPNLPGEFILFKDGTDDFTYLEIDGKPLFNDNDWTGISSTENLGGNITVMDVSDPKYNDGEWVSFRMIMWEGGGGDNVALYWDQNEPGVLNPVFTQDSVPGTFGNLVPLAGVEHSRKDPGSAGIEDLVPASDFRHPVEGGGTLPGLRADIFLGGNPGTFEGVEARVQAGDFVASPVLSNIYWHNSANGANYPSNGTGGNVFGDAGVAIEGLNPPEIDANGYKEYGVNLTGQIFIPGDAQRTVLPVTGGNHLVLFKDGVDDYTYLEIDGQVLIRDNQWTGPNSTDNGGGQVSLMDVSDPKFDDGEWVTFRMTTWEGGGGDSGVLYWSARDTNGTFGISSVPGSTSPAYEISGTSQVGSESTEERFGTLTLPPGDWLTVLKLANTGTTAQRVSSVSIAAPPGAQLAVTSFNYNPANTLLNLGFVSESGSSYALEYTIGFEAAGLPASPQKWTVVPTHGNIAGLNGTTNIIPLNVSTLLTPAGLLPDGSKCFFRIRKL